MKNYNDGVEWEWKVFPGTNQIRTIEFKTTDDCMDSNYMIMSALQEVLEWVKKNRYYG